jgi:general secretion pathway protein J
MSARRAPGTLARGFTLVEVLVALFILAILTGMAFRGVDAIARAKDHALAATDHTLKLNTGMSQFEYDASQIVNTEIVDPISFDGATLRLTRRTPDGLQLVLWTLQAHRWQRWASAPLTHVPQLQEAWLRSQQWESIAGNAITVLDDVSAFQVYTYCIGSGWGNVQSTCTNGQQPPNQPPPQTPPPQRNTGAGNFPTGIRIQVSLPEGNLVRERELPAL